jgi:hypothetical protein
MQMISGKESQTSDIVANTATLMEQEHLFILQKYKLEIKDNATTATITDLGNSLIGS